MVELISMGVRQHALETSHAKLCWPQTVVVLLLMQNWQQQVRVMGGAGLHILSLFGSVIPLILASRDTGKMTPQNRRTKILPS